MKILYFTFSLLSGNDEYEILNGYNRHRQPYNAGRIRTALKDLKIYLKLFSCTPRK